MVTTMQPRQPIILRITHLPPDHIPIPAHQRKTHLVAPFAGDPVAKRTPIACDEVLLSAGLNTRGWPRPHRPPAALLKIVIKVRQAGGDQNTSWYSNPSGPRTPSVECRHRSGLPSLPSGVGDTGNITLRCRRRKRNLTTIRRVKSRYVRYRRSGSSWLSE